MKILIRNGTIVTSKARLRSDILICNGLVKLIESNIQTSNADKVIDAKGFYILPGGVDPHVHMHLPTPAGFSSDDFLTGSNAAIYGGTTTLLDFVTPGKGQSLTDALKQRKDEARESMLDFSFHVSPVDWRKTTENEIHDCINEGISSFKVYMAYKDSVGLNDGDLIKVMKAVGERGKMVTVHCESGDDIELLRNKYFSENHIEPKYHSLSRPAGLEALAVKKAIDLANQSGCTLYIVHVSSKESLIHIEEAQMKGQQVYAETCPQYLLLDDSKYEGDFVETSPFIISPPLRKKEDNNALWDAISKGIIQTAGTDHCPFTLVQKKAGIKDFRKIPNGAGGVEHRLALLYTYGVLENRIDMNQLVNVFSTLPARIFGLYPAKGDMVVGSDADIVIWNPDVEDSISAKTHHQNCDVNIYEGIKTRGKAEYVIAGGEIVIEKGSMINSEIRGKFLRR
jgi:dihydropyrimidinase